MCSKTCGTKSALLAHAQSPVHQTAGMYDAAKGLQSFSGRSRHIDSRQYEIYEDKRVMKYLGSLLRGLKRKRIVHGHQ